MHSSIYREVTTFGGALASREPAVKLWITGTARVSTVAPGPFGPRRTSGGPRCPSRGAVVRAKAHRARRLSVFSERGGCTEVLTVLRVRANLGGHRLRAAPAALILSGAARGGLVTRRHVWGRTPLRPHPRHGAGAVAARARPRLRCALPELRIEVGAMSTPLHRRLRPCPKRRGRRSLVSGSRS